MPLLVAQTSAPAPIPPTLGTPPTSTTDWAIVLAAAAWIGRQAWELFARKEEQESALTKILIDDLRLNQSQLVAGNRAGFQELVDATQDLKGAVIKMGDTIHTDVQSTLKSQSSIYAATSQALTEINMTLKSAHQRLDNLFELIQQLKPNAD